ncbi:unnamed protein product, partial [Closterium sp. Naga37s-1]
TTNSTTNSSTTTQHHGGRVERGERGGGSSSGPFASCKASSLKGYEHSVTIKKGFLLHWTLVNGTSITTNRTSSSSSSSSNTPSGSSDINNSASKGGRAKLRLALEAQQGSGAESGWISIGWSTDGRMVPADAVIGNLPGRKVAEYSMTGYRISDVTATRNFSVTE